MARIYIVMYRTPMVPPKEPRTISPKKVLTLSYTRRTATVL
jgi:hypothetical protein